MDLSTIIAIASFTVMLVIQLLSAGIFIGGLIFSIKFQKEQLQEYRKHTEEQFKRLEEKQDKHNCLIERMAKVEGSASAAHHRIDELRGGCGHDSC